MRKYLILFCLLILLIPLVSADGQNAITVLMIHPYGVNGSLAIVDQMGHTVTNTRTMTYIDNVTFPFYNYTTAGFPELNGTSVHFNNDTTGVLYLADSDDWYINGCWTISFVYKENPSPTAPFLISQGTATTASNWRIYRTQPYTLNFLWNDTSYGCIGSCGRYAWGIVTPYLYSFTKYTIVRNNYEDPKLYVNGILLPVSTVYQNGTGVPIPNINAGLRIGGGFSNISRVTNGYLSEIRIQRGVADVPEPIYEPQGAPFNTWYDEASQLNATIGADPVYPNTPFNVTLYANNLFNLSWAQFILNYPSKDLYVDNVYINNTNIDGLAAEIDNTTGPMGIARINISNISGRGLIFIPDTGASLVDVQFRYKNQTTANDAPITFNTTGESTVLSSGGTHWFANESTDMMGSHWFFGITGATVRTSQSYYPHAAFTSFLISGLCPIQVQFNDTSLNTTGWNWSFGDGTYSNVQNPQHVYTGYGSYTVTLNATSAYAYDILSRPGYIVTTPCYVETTVPTPTPTPLPTPPYAFWVITVDRTSETSITWNVSQKPGPLEMVAYDGITLSGIDPNATILIQSGLHGGERHSISAIANATLANQTAYTNMSGKETTLRLQTWTYEQINTWFYLIFIIVFMIIAVAFRRNPVLCYSLNFLAAAISLYALYQWLTLNPAQITDILHLPFFIYTFFFVFPLGASIFEKRR